MDITDARRMYEMKKRLLELGDGVEQVGDGKDIIGLLMRAMESEDDRLSKEELLAQMSAIVLAATDTTSSALSRILHLLALHPDIQDKLRKELKEACEDNGEITHDQLVSLPNLEAVCRETLRLYAPVPGIMRTARSDVVLPLSSPIHDLHGRKIHEIFVPENRNLYIQIYNLNRDPSLWDRCGNQSVGWHHVLRAMQRRISQAYTLIHDMIFMDGLRSCIGFKLSLLEMSETMVKQKHLVGLTGLLCLEVEIIPAFRLAPTEAEVVWRNGGISTPSIKSSAEWFSPKLPIVISRA
ncbi:cytochrome P450 [Lactarius hengduanensis]|nr:cytochrome P450 [Lactarius hengduanensis]